MTFNDALAETIKELADKAAKKEALRERIKTAIIEAAEGHYGTISHVCISTELDKLLFPLARMSEGRIRADESLPPDTIIVHKNKTGEAEAPPVCRSCTQP
jgi:hypothetical protein